MKKPLRVFIFTYISVYLTQLVVNGFVFGGDANITLFTVIIALSLLNFLITPVFGILSLPSKGPGFIFLRFILNLAIFYILLTFIPAFNFSSTTISELNILGVVLPSKRLTKTWALVFSALLFVLFLNFFKWLCSSKR